MNKRLLIITFFSALLCAYAQGKCTCTINIYVFNNGVRTNYNTSTLRPPSVIHINPNDSIRFETWGNCYMCGGDFSIQILRDSVEIFNDSCLQTTGTFLTNYDTGAFFIQQRCNTIYIRTSFHVSTLGVVGISEPPAQEKLFLRQLNARDFEITGRNVVFQRLTIIDRMGRQVADIQNPSKTFSLDLPPGIYVFVLSDKDQFFRGLFVKS